MIWIFQTADRFLTCVIYSSSVVAHVAGWKPCNPHDLGHISWVGSVLYRSCTTSHNGRLGSTWSINRSSRSLSVLTCVLNQVPCNKALFLWRVFSCRCEWKSACWRNENSMKIDERWERSRRLPLARDTSVSTSTVLLPPIWAWTFLGNKRWVGVRGAVYR